MKLEQTIAIAIIFLASCISSYEKIDLKAAQQLVYLDSNDLKVFSQLRQQLISDSAAIRKQNDVTTAPPNRTSWMSTNSYYLNQIDSAEYVALYSKLKGKLVDNIHLNRNGNVIFTIKENIQMNSGDYNETYSHLLISSDCKCPISNIFNHIDTVFVDSAVNKDWRYNSNKALTGH